jgi:iron only hydrogenase large subunit-like protein
MGSLVKTHLSGKLNVAREKIYHLTVMPCFDKKLEASRENFKDDVTGAADVDLVITAVELEQVAIEFLFCFPPSFFVQSSNLFFSSELFTNFD